MSFMKVLLVRFGSVITHVETDWPVKPLTVVLSWRIMILGSDLLLHQLHVMNEHQTLNLVDFIILLLLFFILF